MNWKILLAVVLGSSLTYAETSAAFLEIRSANEFEFIHCVATVEGSDKVPHLVVDIRADNHKLYKAEASPQASASDLELTLIDDNLVANTIDTVDVSWVSEKNQLSLELDILDNGGYIMDGVLNQGSDQYPVICRDVTIE